MATLAPTTRDRILERALALLAEHGTAGMSMRQLAAACDLNVATLYHYFPSKQELFRAAITHQRYDALLSRPLSIDPEAAPAERLGGLLVALAEEMLETEELWRVLLAECLHGDREVLEPLLGMSAAFEEALGHWLGELVPDVPALAEPAFVHALRHALYGLLIEYLPQPEPRRDAVVTRARELGVVFTRLASVPPHDPLEPTESP